MIRPVKRKRPTPKDPKRIHPKETTPSENTERDEAKTLGEETEKTTNLASA